VFLAIVVGACFANVHHNSIVGLHHSHPAQLEEDTVRLVELEHELEEIRNQLIVKRLLEEHPRIEDAYNKNAKLDLKSAMCELSELGRNFAICVENEAYSVELYQEKLSVVVDIVISVIGLGPIKAALLTVTEVGTGQYARALDTAVNAVASGLGDPTGPIRALIAGVAEGVIDRKFMVCTICAMALAWAIANAKTTIRSSTATALYQALAHRYTLKGSDVADQSLCPLTASQLDAIGGLAVRHGLDAGGKVTAVLRAVAESYITVLRDDIIGVLAAISRPFETLSGGRLSQAQQMALNIDHPSTAYTTPMKKGGWLVEDLTQDYFTEAADPLTDYEPSFKYRDCQRMIPIDVRGCSRECECSVL
jgi:hypothetical protein